MRDIIFRAAISIAFVTGTRQGLSHEIMVVHPPSFEDVEGSTSGGTDIGPSRFHQVFVGELFPDLPESHRWISAYSYRPDGRVVTGPESRVTPQMEVHLSTTNKTPEGLSLTFSENIGADETLVYDGPVTFSTENSGPPGGPKDFDMTVQFERPFYYDRDLGNLLLELIAPEGFMSPSADGCCTGGEQPPSGWVARTGDISLPTADLRGFIGGIQFTFVPEPSSFLLLGVAAFGLFHATRRRNLNC